MQPEGEEEEPRPRLDGQRSERWLHVALAQDDLVSIKFDVSSYFQGAAHPNSIQTCSTYDLKNGKQLKLSDLFKPGAKFLQAIATYCIGDLKKQAERICWWRKLRGRGGEVRQLRSWTITKRGLGIISTPTRLAHTPPAAVRARAVLDPERSHQPDGPIPGSISADPLNRFRRICDICG